jgi:NitT/TauT family transport system substrate-binding protein
MQINNMVFRSVIVAAALGMAACGTATTADGPPAGSETVGSASVGSAPGSAPAAAPAGRLRLGYFPNVTHAPAIVGVEKGLFAAALGDGVDLELVTFNSGTEVIEALFAGAIDASFIGPNPAINGFARSEGEALRIVSGTTSGGAALVVRAGIEQPADLAGTTLATPSLGNTQDVALRAWLDEQGLSADTTGGGDVSIRPQENADTLAAFIDGSIDGAWVPEPWATRLGLEGGGTVLLDERDLWPGGQFVTTHLVVATPYLSAEPDIVRALLTGLLDTLDVIAADPAAARQVTNDGIERITTKRLKDATIDGAWSSLEFTHDPIAASLVVSKDHAVAAGLLKPVDLAGIYDLTILNELLRERGLPPVSAG